MNDQAVQRHESGADGGQDGRMRIGLVATDPLRILGLQQMLSAPGAVGQEGAEVVPLSVPRVLKDVTIPTVFIDASCTEHLFELLTTFRRMRPQVKLIVIGESIEPAYIQRVIGAGARGYVTQGALEREILMALQMVNDGSVWAPRRVLARLLDASLILESANDAVFTERESQILELLVTGLGNREVGRRLAISESAVKAHVTRLMRKVGVTNRVGLTLYVLQRLPALRSPVRSV